MARIPMTLPQAESDHPFMDVVIGRVQPGGPAKTGPTAVKSGLDGLNDQVRARDVEGGVGLVDPLHHSIGVDQDEGAV